jgi:prolyl oligopeptidase
MRLPFLASLLSFSTAVLLAAPPVAPVKPVADTYHGVTVSDPYRWLENWEDPAAKTWSDGQNIHARGVLDTLPGVAQVRARATKILSASSTSYGSLQFSGGKLFALKRQPPKQQPFIVVMDSPQHPETARVLVDPNTLNTKGTTAVDWFTASPDGKLLAVSLSEGGSESGDLHFFEVATGREMYEVLPRVHNGTGGGAAAWLPDSKSLFYTRYPRGTERPVADRDFYMQLHHHTLGQPTEQDRYEIGKDFPKIAEVIVETTRAGVALVSMQKGDGGEFQHYARTLDGKWHQLTRYEDRVVQAGFGQTGGASGTTPIYLLSLKDAPHGQLLRLTLSSKSGEATVRQARIVLAQGKDTLISEFAPGAASFAVTDSRIYATYQLGGPSEVRVFDLTGRPQPAPQQFPVGAVNAVIAAGERGDDVLFHATSYIEPRTWFTYEAKSGRTEKTPLSQTSPVDFAEFEVVREWAVSKDGTKVPVNIIRKKGLKLDGSHPCLLTGYGGYGVNIDPEFSAARRVLVEQGVVFAEANIRGGGEFGDEWHRQGNLTKKQNVFDDFAAAAEHLVKAGYTKREKLALEGGSNGGLLMGATFTQHPDIARTVVSHVGIYDMLRVELSANGAFNIPEFGTVKDEAQFKALYAYSPYHHVREGVKYPPILFLTGANDPRVDPLQSRKMTARLQAAGADVLLRTSSDAGHGIGSSLQQRIDQTVDVDAYLFHQLGITYRPVEN